MKTPPRLVARTLTVTFAMVAVILTVVFVVVTLDARDRVRAAETDKLRVSENVFSALETKRQQDQVAAMTTLAENPTLKGALDTYFTERRFSGASDEQLRATVMGETAKLAMQTPADVLAVVETNGKIFTSAGPGAGRWPAGTKVDVPGGTQPAFQTVAVLPAGAFRVTGARMTFGDRPIGALVAGTSLDGNYAQELSNLSTAGVVITVNDSVVARTYTAGHSERVSTLSVMIGRIMNLSATETEVLRLGALLHDIGKIGISDQILRKNGSLTAEEFEQIKRHPGLGGRILRQVPFLAPHLPIVELHHERPDGRGYPFGLRAEDIPLAARIVHVADAFDAMTSARAYRAALPAAEALAELDRFTGTQFDPACVEALLAAMPSSHDIEEPALAHLLGRQLV